MPDQQQYKVSFFPGSGFPKGFPNQNLYITPLFDLRMENSKNKLERILHEFYSLIPTINLLCESSEFKAGMGRIENGENPYTAFEKTNWRINNFTIAPGYRVNGDHGEIFLGLLPESNPSREDIFSEVYKSILLELHQNLRIAHSTVFYPAIGDDWRIADIWSDVRIVGIDPREPNWERKNFHRIQLGAQEFQKVRIALEKRGLPTAGDFLVSKGLAFADSNDSLWNDPGRYQQFMNNYLNPGGMITAFGKEDLKLAKRFGKGVKVDAISPRFQELLNEWKIVEKKYPCPLAGLGFWRCTDVEVYQFLK